MLKWFYRIHSWICLWAEVSLRKRRSCKREYMSEERFESMKQFMMEKIGVKKIPYSSKSVKGETAAPHLSWVNSSEPSSIVAKYPPYAWKKVARHDVTSNQLPLLIRSSHLTKCFSYLSVNSHSSVINIRLFGYEPKNREGGTNLNIFWDFSRFWLVQAHLSASSWSLSSSFPSFLLTLYRKLVPWKPLPWPSKRMTMALKLLTRTVVQSTLNCSDTICPPGVPSLWETHKNIYGGAD